MPKFDNGIDLAASMGQAFAIQTFFIPVIRKSKNQESYQKYTSIAYLLGFSTYLYIAMTGSYGKIVLNSGILHRTPLVPNP